MDGDNQRAILDAFFEAVVPGQSLVFTYLKHSPLQEERTDRLIVGAARGARVTPPPMWNQSGNPPFSSSMWETIVEHSLRAEMAEGILLPYQQLIPLLDEGADISEALAWAPEGRTVEFSYVTEHLSDDAAIEALSALQAAAEAMDELGIAVPEAGIAWVGAEIERLWQLRGPVPGLPGVLKVLGVQQPYVATRAVLAECPEESDPWDLLLETFADPSSAPGEIGAHIGTLQARCGARCLRHGRQSSGCSRGSTSRRLRSNSCSTGLPRSKCRPKTCSTTRTSPAPVPTGWSTTSRSPPSIGRSSRLTT